MRKNHILLGAVICAASAIGACGSDDEGTGGAGGGDGGAVQDGSTSDAGSDGSAGGGSAEDGGGSDGGSTSGGDGSPGDAGGGDAATCGASPFDAAPMPANLLLVVDKSGSMDATPAGFTSDKWTALTGALETALGQVQESLAFGLDLYPTGAFCEVPSGADIAVDVTTGADQAMDVVMALEAVTPEGSTPTADALSRALDYYTSGAGAALEGQKFVLLATDGGPNCNGGLTCGESECVPNMEGNCNVASGHCCDPSGVVGADAPLYCLDDDDTLAAVEALADAGISTAVVGIPGSEAFSDVLDSLAVAGGMVSGDSAHDYFEVTADGTGAGSLADVLNRVTSRLITTCELQLESDPPDLNQLNVEVDGERVPRDAADGWELDTGTSPPTVRLKGALCETVESEGASSVDVTFGCPTLLI